MVQGISHETGYRGCSAPLIGIGQVRHGMHFILATLIGQGTAVPFFVHKTYGTPAPNYSGWVSHFVYLGLIIFGVQNAIRYSHRARATPTPPTLELNKTAACNISHGATTYILRSTTGSHNTHCGWAIWMRRCDALRAP